MLKEQKIGDLLCRHYSASEDINSALVCCHGYGAPGTDLVSLGAEFVRANPKLKNTRFYFPEAPLELAMMFGARAWWNIDMARLEEAMQSGKTREMRSEVPEGLKSARQKLERTLDLIAQEFNLPFSKIVVGGFSQGAMLTTDVALQSAERFGGLMVLSGALINEEVWAQKASKRSGFKVFQSHGTQDPILGYAQSQDLKALFEKAEFENTFVSFDGGHTIAQNALLKAAAFLGEILVEND